MAGLFTHPPLKCFILCELILVHLIKETVNGSGRLKGIFAWKLGGTTIPYECAHLTLFGLGCVKMAPLRVFAKYLKNGLANLHETL